MEFPDDTEISSLRLYPMSKPHFGSMLCTARVPPQKYMNSQNEDH
ncbi:5316_t:CDS:2 [Funneliformis caledonium]|uniref:5316_t:CDS:1 n=1 Tax=Funneliformis caledonium TaxID=1117310 RepID=A0A9N9F0Z8_9GLOM|nr:5316_t:CDS:2 [Funneliformis caledonium]